MNKKIKEKIIAVCNQKIEKKGENVGLSFYAFFANKNDNPELLMEVVDEIKFSDKEYATYLKNWFNIEEACVIGANYYD